MWGQDVSPGHRLLFEGERDKQGEKGKERHRRRVKSVGIEEK